MDKQEDHITITIRKVGDLLSVWINGEPITNIELDSFKIDEMPGLAIVIASGKIIKQGDE